MGQVTVHAAPLPFSTAKVKTVLAEGQTLKTIVLDLCREDMRGSVSAVVLLNGTPIRRSQWSFVTPKDGDLVNIRIVPTGGGGGTKSILAMVVVVAAVLAGGAGGAALAIAMDVGTASAAATFINIGMVVGGIVGLVAASALMSTAKPSSAGTVSDPSESTTQFIEGASNSIDPFGVVPVCLGTNRIFPPQAARGFTETQDNDQFVRQLFTWGYGDKIELSNIQLGDTPIDDFTDYEIEHKLEGDLNTGTSLYTNDVYQDDYSVLLKNADGYTQRTAHADSDEAIIDFTFSRGLTQYNDSGNRTARSVQIEVAYSVSGADTWVGTETITVTGSTGEALRKSHRFVFPSRGDYDIRAKRLTEDTTSDRIIDEFYLSAIKAVRYSDPVLCEGICGTAIRIKATDQLNGAVDQLNAIVKNHILDYDADTDSWIVRATSNPASIYRYVLQGFPNSRPLADSKIILSDLEDWHVWCTERGYTYNRVIDYETSVNDVLRDVAAAGTASPAVLDGRRTVVIDKPKDDIIQLITPRNSSGYKGDMMYPELPHALRVTFRNENKGYETDERIVYNDGYDDTNATLFETYEVQSCTDPDLAFKYGRRIFALAKLRPENHMVTMDFENLVATRGDRVKLEHDIPMVGVGDARIKSVTTAGAGTIVTTEDGFSLLTEDGDLITADDTEESVTSITLDDVVTIPQAGATYYVRIRKADGTHLYKELLTSVGSFTSFDFAVPFAVADAPEIGDLCMFYEAGGELDCIITKIEPKSDLSATLTLQNYAPEVFNAETSAIPAWESKITVPLEFMRLSAPVLVTSQGDETVLLKNADGSFTSRAVFTLENTNTGDVLTEVKIRRTGDTQFKVAEVLDSTPTKVSITGLTDGYRYDIRIFYRRANGGVYSLPLQINNFLYIGVSGLPTDVSGFRVDPSGEVMLFQWDESPDIDFLRFEIRYSPLYTGALWDESQVIEPSVKESRVTRVALGGTYMIKSVDQSGNYSENPAVVIAYNYNLTMNAVETIDEHPSFVGAKDNVEVLSGALVLTDTTQVGYYYFANEIDLLGVFPSLVLTAMRAYGVNLANSSALNDIFAMSDIFGVDDVFGIGATNWTATVEFRYTEDDPALSSAVWSDWAPLVAGTINLRGAQFRLKLVSYEEGISPAVPTLSVSVDMPDRIERGYNQTVPVGGATVVYPNAFFASPAVAILIQDGATDDKIEFVSKTADGFAFKVYNATAAGYVERTYDYIVSGYGRISA